MSEMRMPVKVLLVVGDQAELTTPERDHTDPERWPAEQVSADTGYAVADLPGKELVAVIGEDGEVVRFQRP
ncbi:hypothetical protein [Wenjunlia vitaminophila]|uniref:hypothetical protein n=1 Tax=Wenjunlia vitaminophila TaxID=76728 RepID=UPI0003AA574D|nr:hypothetical protein [Wenjunlia vitaminophila]